MIDFMECIYMFISIGVYCIKKCIVLYFNLIGILNCYCKFIEC